jgi:hypothetical protein
MDIQPRRPGKQIYLSREVTIMGKGKSKSLKEIWIYSSLGGLCAEIISELISKGFDFRLFIGGIDTNRVIAYLLAGMTIGGIVTFITFIYRVIRKRLTSQ